MPSIIINGETFKYIESTEDTLFSVLAECSKPTHGACGGCGKCGKCGIILESGELRDFNDNLILPGSTALACSVRPRGNLKIRIAETSIESSKASKEAPVSLPQNEFGVAFDIGTTTIGMSVLDYKSNTVIYEKCEMNRQSVFGVDVISRITAASSKAKLHETLINQLGSMIASSGCNEKKLRALSIAGNTVMQHFAAGYNARSLGEYPYTPASRFGCCINSDEIGLTAYGATPVYFAPCPSAFIGGDIIAGLPFAENDCKNGPSLYIDLGTNGEMVLCDEKTRFTASAAAGPALEGGELECGVCACKGAISGIDAKGSIHVIGGGEPCGICGSAVFDAIAFFLRNKKISPEGEILSGENRLYLADNVYLTQGDIRAIQLAKAAIRSALQLLIFVSHHNEDEIENAVISGGFGCRLNTVSIFECGLLPASFRDKTRFVENCAGKGAVAALRDEDFRERLSSVADSCVNINLAEHELYSESFLAELSFFSH